jgi:hypothetical protein
MGTCKPFKLADTRSRRLLLDTASVCWETASVCWEKQHTCRCKQHITMSFKKLETIVAVCQKQAAYPVKSRGCLHTYTKQRNN